MKYSLNYSIIKVTKMYYIIMESQVKDMFLLLNSIINLRLFVTIKVGYHSSL